MSQELKDARRAMFEAFCKIRSTMTPNEIADCLLAAAPSRDAQEAKDAALLWALYHHQGASSNIGQPIRTVLGIGRFERLSDEQVKRAQKFASATITTEVLSILTDADGTIDSAIAAMQQSEGSGKR